MPRLTQQFPFCHRQGQIHRPVPRPRGNSHPKGPFEHLDSAITTAGPFCPAQFVHSTTVIDQLRSVRVNAGESSTCRCLRQRLRMHGKCLPVNGLPLCPCRIGWRKHGMQSIPSSLLPIGRSLIFGRRPHGGNLGPRLPPAAHT